MRFRHAVARKALGFWIVLGLLPFLSHRGKAQALPSTTLTFNSTADTYVDSGSATKNFNSSTILRAAASPTRVTYLRFAVTGVNGRQVQKARLRLGVSAGAASGGTVHLISNNTWSETAVTFNTRPAVDGSGLQTLGTVATGATVEFILDGAITSDGTYNLAIDSSNTATVSYNSTLATSGQKPQLVLTVAAQAPTVTIAQPPTGASYFTGDAITLQASAHDSAGVDLSTHVVWTSNLAGPLGTGAVVTTSLGQGTHTITATVTDGQGLTGSSQISLTVTPPPPGNTAPLVTITAPASGQTLTSSAPITFTGSASDLEDGDLTAAIAWTSDRDGALGTGGTITHMLSEGTHQLTATVADRGGLTATATVTVAVVVGVTLEFPVVADASVDAGLPTTNFGMSPTLAADANLVRNTYLRFTVSGLATRTVLGAVLRLQVDATSGAESDSGGTLHTITDGTWQETAITFNNRPAVDGPTVASQGPVRLGQTVDFNVASALIGDGTYNFAIVNTSADECDYRSREGGPAPTLIVTVARAAPTVTIATPAAGSVFFQRDAITFAARANDAEDGDLSSRIEWTSSRDGSLGAGATVTTRALSVGLHVVTAAVTDSGGLGGQAQTAIRVRAPNTPPAVTIASPADGSSVPAGTAVRLGAAASDDFDGDLTGQIRWTSSRDGALGPNGTRVLSEGAHTLVAAVTDSDGAPGSATARLTVTPTPPVVTIVAPADGTTIFAGMSLAFGGTATDATDGDLSAALRWLSDRDGQIGSGPSFTTTRLSTGTHSITAVAADAGGLTGEAVLRVVVRPPNVPPVVRVVALATGTTLLAGKPVLLAATATDVEDGDLGAALVWTSSRDGALGTGRTVVAPGLSPGTHTLTAAVADRDGATASASVTVTVVPSTLVFPPSADTYVDAGSASAKFGGATSLLVGASPARQALLRFAVTGIGQFRVQQALLHMTVGSSSGDGSAAGGTVRAITNGAWSEATTTYNTRPAVDGAVLATRGSVTPKQVVDFDVTQGVAADGTLNFALVSISSDWVRYASREASAGKPELRITLTQNTAPLVTILAPASGTRVLPGSPVAFAGAATDAEDGDLGSRIEWSSSLDGPLGTGATLATTALRPGVHTISARVTDAGGLVGQASITLTVTHPPVVTVATPADGTVVFTSGLPMTFTGRATDVEDGDLGARIAWSSDRDGPLGTGLSVTAGALSVGAHVISARVTDDDGLRGEARISVRVRSPNAPPRVTIAVPAEGRAVPAGTPLTLGATAADDFDGDVTSQIEWTSSRDGLLGPGPVRTVTLSEGSHTLVASATDSDGAVGSAQVHVTITSSPPVVTIAAPPAGTRVFVGTSVAFSGTATDATDGNLTPALRWTSDRDGAIGVGGSFATTRLSIGTHTVTAAATDAGGLTGHAERTVVVRPPNVPPAITIVAPAPQPSLLTGRSVLLGAVATDTEDGNLGTTVRWASSRDGALGAGTTLVVPSLSVGAHTLTASVTDADGATASASVVVTVVPSQLALLPIADTYVDAGAATTRLGTATSLLVGASPVRQAFLRFAVNGIGRFSVQQALLRLTVGSSSSDASALGGAVHAISNHAWPEATTTYRTRPLIDGPALAVKGRVLPKQAVDFDVTSAVAADGTYDFALDSTSSDWVRYGSREATTGKPQLLIALVQNLAPLVTITAPGPSATVDLGTAVTFSATAIDAESGDLGARIVWSSDRDGILGSGASITAASLSHGPHAITARTTDAGGRTGEAQIAIMVASPPILTITAPAEGTVLVPGAAATFSAAASEVDVGDLSGSITWTSSLDGLLGTGGTITTSTLHSGTHAITASVTDGRAKVAAAMRTVVVNAAPTIAITGPAEGAGFVPGETIRFTGAAQDREDGNLSAAIAWRSSLDGPLGSGGTLDVSTLRSGTHTITATVTDAGRKRASAEIVVIVNAPPTVTITAPAAGSTLAPGEVVHVAATASDAEDGDLSAAIAWRSSLDGPLGSGGTLGVSTLRSGTHTITAAVADSGGKTAEARTTVVVNAPPQLRIVAPTEGSVLVPGDLVRFEGTATDVEDGDLSAAVTWTSSVDGPLGAGGTLSVSLRSGTHTITASVTDTGGKRANAQITLIVNAPPTLHITAPAEGALLAPGEIVTFVGAARDLEDGDLGGEITWTSSLDGPLGTGSRLDVSRLRSGTHTITASVADRGGKTASAALTVIVNAVPILTITGPANGFDSVLGAAVVFTATASDTEDGGLDAAIQWSSSLDGPLGSGPSLRVATLRSGTHTVTAAVTDSGGRTVSQQITVVVNAPPTLVIASPPDGATFLPGDAVALEATASDAEDGDLGPAIRWASSLDGPLGTGGVLRVGTLRSGTHLITARVTDGGGKAAEMGVTIVVNAAPEIAIAAPASGSVLSPGDGVSLVATATDAEDGDLGEAIEWMSSLDGPLGSGGLLTGVTLRSGTHVITASVRDSGGRSAAAEVTVVVNAAPTVTITGPPDGSTCSPGEAITLTGAAADAEDGDLGAAIEWSSGLDGPLGTGSTVGLPTLRSGTHAITAWVTDRGGKRAHATVTLVVNAAPSVEIVAPSSRTTFAPDEPVTLTASAEDAEDGDLSPAIAWSSSLQGPLGAGGTLAGGTLGPGTHVLTASVTDGGGKSASATTTIVVAPLITLEGSRSTAYTNLSLAGKTKIDLTAATFFASPSNLYPVNLSGGAGVHVLGGTVLGQYDRSLGWDDMHSMNNAGIVFDDSQSTVDGIRVDNVTDGVRPRLADDFTIRNVHLSYVRDDCVENDHLHGGLVDDSLFDGCYEGFSARPSDAIIASGFDGSSKLWTIQNSLVRLQPMPGPRGGSADGLGNGAFFKWHNWNNPDISLSPKLALYNNVFMAERVGQPGASRMGIPPEQLRDCANNVMVWLGPGDYPTTLPSCFTVTKDRSVWDNAVADWLARHPGVAP